MAKRRNGLPISPLKNLIILRKEREDEKTSGGIYLPDQSRRDFHRGEVLALGPKVDPDDVGFKVGDRVVIGEYSGTDMFFEKGGGKPDVLTITPAETVLAVLHE
ncbi:MAG: co-chaperone GroES [Candidatus Eisenbacteria bacterium]|nr:co-chaperone GroES [Candidatus Eisenbacteria bacterium]